MSSLRCVCLDCGAQQDVTGRGTIARHSVGSGWGCRRRQCVGSGKLADGAEKWAAARCSVLMARIDGHAARVAEIRTKAAQEEASADKWRDEAVAELAAIDSALAARAKAAAKAVRS